MLPFLLQPALPPTWAWQTLICYVNPEQKVCKQRRRICAFLSTLDKEGTELEPSVAEFPPRCWQHESSLFARCHYSSVLDGGGEALEKQDSERGEAKL